MLPPAVATGGRESTDRPGATPAPRLLNATRWPPGRLAGRTPTLRFQTLFEHLRLPLVVVQRGPGRRQTLHAAGLEAALLEPVRGAGGEHEQGLQAQGAGALLDAFEQRTEEHTAELQSRDKYVSRLLLATKKHQ